MVTRCRGRCGRLGGQPFEVVEQMAREAQTKALGVCPKRSQASECGVDVRAEGEGRARLQCPAEEEVDDLRKVWYQHRSQLAPPKRREQRQQDRKQRRVLDTLKHPAHAVEHVGEGG